MPFGDGGDSPLDSLANLADVMLVLAVGFMLALVINWNVDIAPSGVEQTPPTEVVTEIEGAGAGEKTPLDSETQYEKMDVTVYRDPATGKLYMVESPKNDG
jgi:hypothetical protein